MMQSIQLGNLVLNGEMVFYIAFGFGGWLALRLALRQNPAREGLSAIASSSMLIWLLVWKASLLLFDPAGVLEQPLSLLYFSGGIRGRWLAGAAAVMYAALRIHKERISLRAAGFALVPLLLGGMLSSQLLLAVLERESGILHLSAAGVCALLLLTVTFFHSGKSSFLSSKAGIKNAIILLAVAGMAAYGIYEQMQKETIVKNDVPAPDFVLLDLDGNRVQLVDLRGQKVLINFWATWCPPCRAEMPHLQRFYEDYKDKGVTVLAVNVTSTEANPETVRRFLEQHGLTVPVVLDPQGKVTQAYNVRSYPTSYILDSEGIIRSKFAGAIDYETMSNAVKAAEIP